MAQLLLLWREQLKKKTSRGRRSKGTKESQAWARRLNRSHMAEARNTKAKMLPML